MYAIIETGAKQYRVEPGQILDVERLDVEAGNEIALDRVLFFSNGSGPQIGQPYLPSVKVTAEVVEEGRDKKVIVYKFRHKVNYHRKKGHRQYFTRLKIKEIVQSS